MKIEHLWESEKRMKEAFNEEKWTLKSLVLFRLDQLSLDEQIVARVAAVVGAGFTPDLLHHAVPPPMRPYLAALLGALVDAHWLTKRAVRPVRGGAACDVQFRFCHPSVQQVCCLAPRTAPI